MKKNILNSYCIGLDKVMSRTFLRLDSLSILSRQSVLAIFVACLTVLGVGNAWATTITNAVYTFGLSSTPSGWSVGSSNTHVANYLKFSSGDYLEMTTASIFTSGEVLSSNNMQVEVSCGTFGSWSGSSYSVKCTVELRNSSGTVLSTANATFSSLNSDQSTYRTAINVAKPANPSAIAKLRITFTNFTTGTTLRVKNVRLNYSTAAAATYNVYLISGCEGGSYSSNKGTSGSGTGTYSSCTKYSGISAGTSVTITATPSSGYEFDGWEDSDYSIIYDASDNEITPSSTTSTTATFTMPSKDVVIWYCNFSESCSNSVTVSNGGSSTNGSITSITTSPVATCSSTASDRRVSIVVTPSTGYVAPTDLSVGSTTGTVNSSKISRTDNGNGTFTFVYQYNQNDNGTISYNAACVGKLCTVTFDKNSGTGGDNSVTATYGSAMTTITPPTREHYDFAGYYDSETNNDGTGNKYYNANGTSAATWNKNTTAATTLYAKWTEHGLKNYRTVCCTDPGLAYGTGSVTKTYGASAFTNTLTNNHSVAVTYSSSDETIATVDADGEVTILKAGSTIITASSIAQTVSTVSYCADEASYTLTVNKADISPTLSYDPVAVTVGNTLTSFTLSGNTGSGSVSYISSDDDIATVNSSGVVTGVAAGTVTITATIAATTNYNGNTATSNTITVNAAACTGTYSLHTGNKDQGGWITNQCFSDVDWGEDDDAIYVGAFPLTNECYVGYAGGGSYYGTNWAVGGIKTYDIPNGRTLGWNSSNYYESYPGGALGTFHIYTESTDENYYLRFKPSSYILRTGSDGTSWTSREMTVSASNNHYYESEELDLTSSLISEHAFVDLKTLGGEGHVWCNFSSDVTASDNVKVKSSVGDADGNFRATNLQAGDAGTHGKFRIDITKDVDNWKLAFVPMYRITYAAGTGASGSMDPSSYAEISTTIAAAAESFTDPTGKQFSAWSDGVNTYAAGDDVTMNSNVTLTAQWADIDYSVTVNQSPAAGAATTGQTTEAHYGGTINLTTTVPDGYQFVNWTTSDGFVISNNTSATTASFTMPAKNVTVTANFIRKDTYKTAMHEAVDAWEDYAEGVAKTGNGYTIPNPGDIAVGDREGTGCEGKHYHFAGWVTNANKEAGTISGNIIPASGTTDATGTTFWAVWEKEAGGGATSSTSITSYEDGDYYIVDTRAEVVGGFFALNGAVSSDAITVTDIRSAVTENALAGTITIDLEDAVMDDAMKYRLTTVGDSITIQHISSSSTVSQKTNDTKFETTGTRNWTIAKHATDNRFTIQSWFTKSGYKTSCLLMQYSNWVTDEQVLTLTAKPFNAVNMGGTAAKGQNYMSGYVYLVPASSISYDDPKVECVCSANPVAGTAAVDAEGTFSASSIAVKATGASTGHPDCSYTDYGFVWSSSVTTPTLVEGIGAAADNCTKVQVDTDGQVTAFAGSITGSFTANNPIYVRSYVKNGKADGTYQYSDVVTITPRSVTFNLNGHGSSAPVAQLVNNGSKAVDPSYSESVTGYIFGGWYKEVGCTNQWDFASDVVSGESKTLYAKWTPISYSVQFNSNDANYLGTATGSMSDQSFDYDESKDLTANGFSLAGYDFAGWATTPTGAVEHLDEAEVENLSSTNSAVVNLYAIWTAKKYNVTLAATNETSSVGSQTVQATYNAAMPLVTTADGTPNVAAPSRTGYTFTGWEYNSTTYYNYNAGTSTLSSAHVWNQPNSTTTLTPKWSTITYTITYNLNSGTNPGSVPTEYTIESSDVTLPTPTRSGYNFDGWYADSDLSTGGVHTTIANGSTGNKEYWAKWTAKTLTSISITPSSGEVYVGQYVDLTVSYDPADYLSQGYTLDATPVYVTKESAAPANTKLRLKGGRGSGPGASITETVTETVTIKASGDNTKKASVEMTVNPLPRVHFVDNIHNETFSDVVATIDDNTLNPNKSTPTHADVAEPGEGNRCEKTHLHLIGWIRSDYSKVADYMAGTGDAPTVSDLTTAGAEYWFLPDADINVETYNGKTFYAVWAVEE